MKYFFALLAVLSTLLGFVAANAGGSDTSFLFLNRNSGVHDHPSIAKRQVQPGQPSKKVSSYRTVVARSPFKEVKRESLSSIGVGTQSKLAVYNAQNTLLGYLAPSTAFKGDYTYVDATSSAAIKVLVTYGTTDVQRLPIMNPPAGTYPYLAGVAGAANTGSNAPPYIPSTDFGSDGSPNGRNYAYLTSANEVAHGAAKPSPNADNSTPNVQTGMFQLRLDGTLVPVWVNSDGTTVIPNQAFGVDASGLVLMYGSQSSINAAYGPSYQGVTIRPILAN